MRFQGYRIRNGKVGVRNIVAVIPCTACINELPKLIAQGIPGALPIGHNLSCSYLGSDLERSIWSLVNLAGNPNVYGVVLLGMGCELTLLCALVA
ncbi:MAG: UxaA family hydrolase [Deltaproteobacteria bacterium]|nr:UxaA family hydrolase [Deltaproteobacteria bacterium]